jgi:hypothetical protein
VGRVFRILKPFGANSRGSLQRDHDDQLGKKDD